jgi:hypothetical protein
MVAAAGRSNARRVTRPQRLPLGEAGRVKLASPFMPQPLSDAVVATLKTDAYAALAAIMVISNAHPELLGWAQRALSSGDTAGIPAELDKNVSETNRADHEAAGNYEPKPNGCRRDKPRREGAKLDVAAYQARRRGRRDADDERLIETIRLAPGASIREWGSAIGKCRTATVQALHRLRDAGLIENDDGNWALVEPQPASAVAPRWIEPLSGARVARHAADGRVRGELTMAPPSA